MHNIPPGLMTADQREWAFRHCHYDYAHLTVVYHDWLVPRGTYNVPSTDSRASNLSHVFFHTIFTLLQFDSCRSPSLSGCPGDPYPLPLLPSLKFMWQKKEWKKRAKIKIIVMVPVIYRHANATDMNKRCQWRAWGIKTSAKNVDYRVPGGSGGLQCYKVDS